MTGGGGGRPAGRPAGRLKLGDRQASGMLGLTLQQLSTWSFLVFVDCFYVSDLRVLTILDLTINYHFCMLLMETRSFSRFSAVLGLFLAANGLARSKIVICGNLSAGPDSCEH
jgi:hypothetical protein